MATLTSTTIYGDLDILGDSQISTMYLHIISLWNGTYSGCFWYYDGNGDSFDFREYILLQNKTLLVSTTKNNRLGYISAVSDSSITVTLIRAPIASSTDKIVFNSFSDYVVAV